MIIPLTQIQAAVEKLEKSDARDMVWEILDIVKMVENIGGGECSHQDAIKARNTIMGVASRHLRFAKVDALRTASNAIQDQISKA
jgi:hypothetical protein